MYRIAPDPTALDPSVMRVLPDGRFRTLRERTAALGMASLSATAGLMLMSAPAASAPGDSTRATHRDVPIPLAEISRNHCHDGQDPLIRCFDAADDRDADIAEPADMDQAFFAAANDNDLNVTVLAYVTFWEHERYGGASYTASQPNPNLAEYGWNDKVTSFKSHNGQRPKWWEHANYGTAAWQWPAGAWVSNVGSGANDTFSSVRNVP